MLATDAVFPLLAVVCWIMAWVPGENVLDQTNLAPAP